MKKKRLGYVFAAVGVVALLGSCAHTPCNNDACYNRELSSVDPYEDGEIAAWGSEKWEKKKEMKSGRQVKER